MFVFILHTRAKRRFLGLWNCSQFLSLANSAIFFLRRSRVTLSASRGPVISLLSNKEKWQRQYYKKRPKTHRFQSERQLALKSPNQPKTTRQVCAQISLGRDLEHWRERERLPIKTNGCFGWNRGVLGFVLIALLRLPTTGCGGSQIIHK